MDKQTLSAYDSASAQYARDWNEQPAPDDLYALVEKYFLRGGPTVDIGCGSGRDAAWLDAHGYEASGYDPSEGLLEEARAQYPGLHFGVAALPELAGLPKGTFQNVLCETVVMHLDPQDVGAATRALLGLLRPSGTLYLSWRVTEGESIRDKAGRLYAAFDTQAVRGAIGEGCTLLFDEGAVSASSGKKIHRLVVRKT